jgi:glucokinase
VSAACTVGVDIGGTKVLAGVVDGAGAVVERVLLQTPDRLKTPAVVEDTIVEAVNRLSDHHEVAAVGVGAAGFVDRDGAVVTFAPHLSWRNEPLKDALEARLHVPVLLDNDANTTAWAEMRFGAVRGHRDLLCVTLGTGIGGAVVVDGRVFRGANGMAGEFGHMQVVPEGRRCECGNRGCWEQYSSGNVLVREARELVHSESPVAARLRELVKGDAALLTGPDVTRAAQEGDRAATELLADVGHWLGTGLAGLVAAFDPEIVVVGGGVSDAGDLLLGPARESLSQKLTGRGFRPEPPIVAASLGPSAGLVGAADLARGLLGSGPVSAS